MLKCWIFSAFGEAIEVSDLSFEVIVDYHVVLVDFLDELREDVLFLSDDRKALVEVCFKAVEDLFLCYLLLFVDCVFLARDDLV